MTADHDKVCHCQGPLDRCCWPGHQRTATVKQVPESVDLAAVFAEHKFGGLRIRPVRMVPAMTGQLTHEPDGNIGMKMVWTLMIEERIHSRHERAFYHEVVTLVAEADAGLPKLLRDVADLIERGPTKVQGSEA